MEKDSERDQKMNWEDLQVLKSNLPFIGSLTQMSIQWTQPRGTFGNDYGCVTPSAQTVAPGKGAFCKAAQAWLRAQVYLPGWGKVKAQVYPASRSELKVQAGAQIYTVGWIRLWNSHGHPQILDPPPTQTIYLQKFLHMHKGYLSDFLKSWFKLYGML